MLYDRVSISYIGIVNEMNQEMTNIELNVKNVTRPNINRIVYNNDMNYDKVWYLVTLVTLVIECNIWLYINKMIFLSKINIENLNNLNYLYLSALSNYLYIYHYRQNYITSLELCVSFLFRFDFGDLKVYKLFSLHVLDINISDYKVF